MNLTTINVAPSVSLNRRRRNGSVAPSPPQLCCPLPQAFIWEGVLMNAIFSGNTLFKAADPVEHELQSAVASDWAGAMMGAYWN
jgi:hypothetical protein